MYYSVPWFYCQALGDARRAEGQVYYPIENYKGLYDGMIDIIDPATELRIASHRFDGLPHFTLRTHMVRGNC